MNFEALGEAGFWGSLGLGFIGGIILNIMPCVLPVLTMKVFHVIEHGKDDPASNRKHGVAYTGGILVAFAIFAAIVIGIRATGQIVGWGMQFGNPAFVAALCTIMLVFGLNALGVFEFSVSVNDSERQGYFGSFVNGVVASVMSTPCSAPFLSVALVYAFAAGTPSYQTLLIFEAIAAGLALPFALISFFPALGGFLPRPGPWMEKFKELMGFSLLAAAAWLFGDVLLSQVTPGTGFGFLMWLWLVSVGVWTVDRFAGLQYGATRRYGVRVGVILVLALSAHQFVQFEALASGPTVATDAGAEPPVVDGAINWASFSPERVASANERGRPVFMDYTAEWCLNCKANERIVLETDTVRDALMETSILPMKADWTNVDATVTEWLQRLGRSAIPVYAIYLPDGSYDLLPDVITPPLVAERLRAAAERYPVSEFREITSAPSTSSDVLPVEDAAE